LGPLNLNKMNLKLKEDISKKDIMTFGLIVLFLIIWTLLTFFVFLKPNQ
jgi:hypothetical protein